VTVDQYLGRLPDDQHAALSALRDVIRETVSRGDGGDRLRDAELPVPRKPLRDCAQKNDMSLYVMRAGTPLARLREATNLDIGKGCVRFKRLAELPLDTVRGVLAEAARANRERAGAVD